MVAGGEHTLVVCEEVAEDIDASTSKSHVSNMKQDSPKVKVVDNRHGDGLRPMKIPSLLKLVQVILCQYPCIACIFF